MAVTTIGVEQALRQRARVAWEEKARAIEAARQEARARDEERLARKCQEVLGQAPTKMKGRDGWVGSLRLRYKGDPYGNSYLCLVTLCPFCGKEIESRPICYLADLGENLVCLKTDHVCTSDAEAGPEERFKERIAGALLEYMQDLPSDEELWP